MQRKSHIQQHPHQEIQRGRAPYASYTGIKSSTNECMEFQSLSDQFSYSLNQSLLFNNAYLEDEDSDERTIYFAKKEITK